MSFLFDNNARSTLASGISAAALTLTVQSGDGALFPNPSGPDTFRITLTDSANNIEIVECTSRTGDVLTIVRNQEASGAKAYLSGDSVGLRITKEVLEEFAQNALTVLKAVAAIKTAGNLTFNDNVQLNLGTGEDAEMFFDGTQLNLDLNGDISLLLRDGNSGNATRFTFNIATGELIVTGGIDITGLLKLKGGYSEDANALAQNGAITCDADIASYFYINGALTGIPTFTFSTTVPSGRVTSFTLELNNALGFPPVWPASAQWADGIEPIWTVGIDIVTFFTRDNGTIWYGFAGGVNMG